MSGTLKFGRKPADPSKPRLRLSTLLGQQPTAPAQVDYHTNVPAWPMYGNDQYGDCVFAAIGHAIQTVTDYGSGKYEVLTVSEILKGYSDVTGFDPNVPSSDQGTNMQDAMDYWRKTGLGGHQILAFAAVNIKDLNEVRNAVDLFGHVQVGINFPKIAMDQFDKGENWTAVVDDGGIDGGHAIHVAGYDSTDFELVTWGKSIRMDLAFWSKYVEEAWVTVTSDWLNAVTEKTPTGLDTAAFGAAFHALTNTPSPFPPAPTPAPVPIPVPTPPSDPDLALWEQVRDWSHARHTGANKLAATQIRSWAKSKGFEGA